MSYFNFYFSSKIAVHLNFIYKFKHLKKNFNIYIDFYQKKKKKKDAFSTK